MSAEVSGAPTELDVAVERALTRAGIYRLLGRAFGYPTDAVVEELGRLAAHVAATPAALPAVREPLGRFATAVGEVERAALADEYVFLFGRQVRCPPYEGAYSQAGQMAGKSAALADIAGFYAAFGLAPSGGQADVPELEDHIAAELEFMSALALKEAYALAEGHPEGLDVTRRAEVGFLSDHLGRWAEAFARAVQEATLLPYFGAASDLLTLWIRAEVEALGATPAPLATPLGGGSLDEETFTCPMAEAEPNLAGDEDEGGMARG